MKKNNSILRKGYTMKRIWNGSETDPHTRPGECAICMGGSGGEFLRLTCGHGAPDLYPIHVTCAVLSFSTPVDDYKLPPRCPICRATVDTDTLLEVANYVQQNKIITFPDDNDEEAEQSVYQSEEERGTLMSIISDAHDMVPDAEILDPTNEELSLKYYQDMINEVESMTHEIQSGIEERLYTLEDLEQKEQDISFVEEKIDRISGRLSLFSHHNWVFFEFRFDELYRRLMESKEKLVETTKKIRMEREEKQREEEEEHRHHLVP
ncbi:hypothetical protein HEQ63_08820 [Haematospirillum jordaniae]|uniref:hypothetical protein n=1 Tax=Haematospirillum jordaniae TaxID=1549855 RepID=UPI00143293A3|nr:hypothetical protein [Haematospirillum jordaniae]NKD86282.1 hypothetical protein [Haematospirillum jordaniae]